MERDHRTLDIVHACLNAVELAIQDRRHQLTTSEAKTILDRLAALAEMVDPEISDEDRPVTSIGH